MIINNEKEFVFVCIAKTASTSIKRFFGVKTDPKPQVYHASISEILKENPHASSYFRFAFVRNPYDRLLSAYMDLSTNAGHLKWAGDILQFKNFEDFVLNFDKTSCRDFVHLRSQANSLCINGRLAMDFIGRFEHLQHDFNTLCEILDCKPEKLPHHRNNGVFSNTSFYSPAMKKKVQELYSEDFRLFNYEK